MRYLLLAPLVFSLVLIDATAQEKQARDPSVAQLKVFDQYVGNWKLTMESADGVVMKGDSNTNWIHGGKLVRQSWTMDTPAGQRKVAGENIMTYDVHKSVYRQWSFNSYGLTTESTGKWDEAKMVMLWTGKDSPGNDAITRSDFSQQGKEKFKVLIKNSDGKVLAEINGVSTRQPSVVEQSSGR